MKQVHMGGGLTNLTANSVHPPVGVQQSQIEGNVFRVLGVAAAPFSLSNLAFEVSAAPGEGNSRALEFHVNGSAVLTATISGTDTEALAAGPVSVSVGDRIHLKSIETGTPANAFGYWSWESNTEDDALAIAFGAGLDQGLVGTQTRYLAPFNGAAIPSSTTESPLQALASLSCTLEAMYYALSGSPGSGNNYALTFRKNGSDEATSTVTVADAATTGNVTGLNIAISAGDLCSIVSVPTSGPTNRLVGYGIAYRVANDGESMIGGISDSAPSSTAGDSCALTPGGVSADFGKSGFDNAFALSGPTSWTLKGFRATLTNAVSAGDTRTLGIQEADAGALNSVVHFDEGETAQDAGSAEDEITSGMRLFVGTTPSGEPPSPGDSRWSAIQFISTTSQPTIVSIVPDEGPETGGTAVTITGTEFAAGATVTIGGNAATSVNVVNDTTITAVTPAGTVGAQDVVVTNTDTGTVTEVGGFTYLETGAAGSSFFMKRRRR